MSSSIYDRLDAIEQIVRAREWDRLEDESRERCQAVDEALARTIEGVSTADYTKAVLASLQLILSSELAQDSRAIVCEFDPDNGWVTTAFACDQYRPRSIGDDDWAAEYRAHFYCADSAGLARSYDPSFDETERAIAGNVYLFARTFAALGRAVEALGVTPKPICAGYHDQEILFRLNVVD